MGEKFWTYAMEEMSYPDVQEILKQTDIALIPIGSQEKHGPPIPLACDSIALVLMIVFPPLVLWLPGLMVTT